MRLSASVVTALVLAAACDTSGTLAVAPSAIDSGSEGAPGLDGSIPPDAPGEGQEPETGSRVTTPLVTWRFNADVPSGAAEVGFDDSGWTSVSVPHTFDGKKLPFVTLSNAWYRTHFQLGATAKAGAVYVEFEGAGTISDVYVNGRKLGEHRGLFTGFVFDATSAANLGDNVLAVHIDNTDADSPDCLPSTPVARRYYEPYGGIYRKAWLLTVDAVHVAPTDLGSAGVYLTPSVPETGGDGTLTVRTVVRNTSGASVSAHVTHRVYDMAGTDTAVFATDAVLAGGATATTSVVGTVNAPHRWSLVDPYLYEVATEISVDGVMRDSVTERTGFRTFRITPTGFFVNGVNTPLRGIAKHQESEGSFTAMTDDELRADWNGMRTLGFNYVRLVHYPHAKLEYDLADSLGFVVWAENGNSTPYPLTATGENETREMVRQNINHPSIAFWSSGNETVDTNNPPTVGAAVGYAKDIRQEDPSRLVTYASSQRSFMDPAFDFMGENLYEALVDGQPWAFGPDAAQYHYVSETGSRATVTQHVDYAGAATSRIPNVFEPEEFIQTTVEATLEAVFRTQAANVPLFTWFAYRDFQLEGRIDGMSNNGLLTYDGAHLKDHAYLFQAFLRPEMPVVKILGGSYYVRRGAADNGIKVYSNTSRLDLTINGTDMGWLANGVFAQPDGHTVDNVFYWQVPLFEGLNYVHVDDGAGHRDDAVVVFAGTGGQAPPANLPDPLVRSVGSTNSQNRAYFVDRPVVADVPVYYDFDGTADNTFASIPSQLVGADQVATLRTSKPQNLSDLALTISATANGGKGAIVFIMTTNDGTSTGSWTAAGFADTGAAGTWRDADMDLVPFKLLAMTVSAGGTVVVPGMTRDYAVLVRAKQ